MWKGSRVPSSSFNCRLLITNILGGATVKDEKSYLKQLSGRIDDLQTGDYIYLKAKLPHIKNELSERRKYLKTIVNKSKKLRSDYLWKEIYYLEALLARAPHPNKLTAVANKINKEIPLKENDLEFLKETISYVRDHLDVIKVRRFGKQTPINSQYAGAQYPMVKLSDELAKKYPLGVWFDDEGFPNFWAYTYRSVEVDITGAGRFDFARAQAASGLDRIPDDMTWHHHQDGKTMLLIPRDIHDAVKHTGGVALATAKIKRVKGVLPAGTEWAGKTYPLENWPIKLRIKYSNGVKYKVNGHPNLNPYSKLNVEIESTGKKQLDFRLANKKARFRLLPTGYTWHLKDDGKTMQLVPRDLLQRIPTTTSW